MRTSSTLKNSISIITCILTYTMIPTDALAQRSPDEKAKLVEQQMTDEERFSLLTSLVGYVPSLGIPKDPRIPEFQIILR